MEIYQPSEDSHLLSNSVKDYLINLNKKINNITNINNVKYNKSSNNKYNPYSLASFINPNHINNKSINSNNNNNSNLSAKFKSSNLINSNKSPLSSSNHINDIKDLIKIIDIGSGSGIQAKTCKKLGFNNILTSDINPNVIKSLKKQGFKSINSNLFEKIKGKFDLIIFNPPYLPEDKNEPPDSRHATTAGKQGYEIIIKFLKQAKSHLETKGTILLLFSSLSKPNIIKKQAKALGYGLKLIKKQNLFFEKIFVYKIKRKQSKALL
ncbi:methyltransferase [Candidatus Pacearchaeota archaeon]|nr:methyltransferase [Candidatus Pacearchaeota archaeon]